MHAILIPIGSHGDVHPFIGLGVALRARGHRVTLVTNPHFAPTAAKAGLEFVPLGTEAEMNEILENADLWKPMKGFQLVMRSLTRFIEPVLEIIQALNVPGETVAASQVTAFGARIAHESLKIPLVTVHLQPVVFLSTIDPPEVPLAPLMRKLPRWGRQALLDFGNRVKVDPLIAPAINIARKHRGLSPVRSVTAWWNSPHSILGLFPNWFAPPQLDWPPHVHLTGFPLFDESTHAALDPDVASFMHSGTPPIVFTAGSAMRHGHDFFSAAADTCRRLDRRGLLLARFHEQIPERLPPNVRHFAYVPFSQILPHAAALVHHGGIGTTAQGLAAALPQLIMPLAHDQPDNAMRLKRLGVGASLARRNFKAPAVARALGELLHNADTKSRAQILAESIRNQDTLGASCRVIEDALSTPSLAPNTNSVP